MGVGASSEERRGTYPAVSPPEGVSISGGAVTSGRLPRLGRRLLTQNGPCKGARPRVHSTPRPPGYLPLVPRTAYSLPSGRTPLCGRVEVDAGEDPVVVPRASLRARSVLGDAPAGCWTPPPDRRIWRNTIKIRAPRGDHPTQIDFMPRWTA